MTPAPARMPDHPVEPLFVERWSPRAFDPVAIDDTQLMILLEAARWAPSAFNAQPRRFLYARRDTAGWDRFLDVLLPSNQGWARNASVLLLCLSDTMMQPAAPSEPRPSHGHSFDAGAAWAQLALQATRLGLAAHGLDGVDFARARTEFGIPERLRIEAGIAVGRPGDKASLPEALQAREIPSDRKPIAQWAFEGDWPAARPA